MTTGVGLLQVMPASSEVSWRLGEVWMKSRTRPVVASYTALR
jgi:hypothetical protein